MSLVAVCESAGDGASAEEGKQESKPPQVAYTSAAVDANLHHAAASGALIFVMIGMFYHHHNNFS